MKIASHDLIVAHTANQPILRSNPCHENTECAQICVLAPPTQIPDYRCLCSSGETDEERNGKHLLCNWRRCNPGSDAIGPVTSASRYVDRMIIAYKNILAVTPSLLSSVTSLQTFHFKEFYVSQVDKITGMAYNPVSDKIVLTDSKNIFQYDLYSQTARQYFGGRTNLSTDVISMGIDENTGNLHWIEEGGEVRVMSLETGRSLDLFSVSDKPCDILVLPMHK